MKTAALTSSSLFLFSFIYFYIILFSWGTGVEFLFDCYWAFPYLLLTAFELKLVDIFELTSISFTLFFFFIISPFFSLVERFPSSYIKFYLLNPSCASRTLSHYTECNDCLFTLILMADISSSFVKWWEMLWDEWFCTSLGVNFCTKVL